MFPRIMLVSSAMFLAGCGLLTLFAPGRVLGVHGTQPDLPTMMLVQMMGALYLGFALVNWAARGLPLGGAGARAVAAGNFLHFLLVTALLGWAVLRFPLAPLWSSALVFGLFALSFGLLLFRSRPKAARV